MAFVRANGVVLNYRVVGAGPRVVFLNSLGSDNRIWDDVCAILGDRFEILVYDKRGHGLSDAPPAPYTIADHADDLCALLDHLGWSRVSLVGLSVGGLIAQHIAIHAPERVVRLVLCDTAARIGSADLWNDRIAAIERSGVASISAQIIARWFTPAFADRQADARAGWLNMLERTPAEGYAGTCAAIRDADYTDECATIASPTLVIVGDGDLSTPPDLVKATADRIPSARFEIVAQAGHLPCIERPVETAALLNHFLQGDAR